MPHIERDTLLVSTYEYFSKMGHYPTSFAINTIYPQTRDTDQVDYWYQPLPRFLGNDWDDYLAGKDVEFGHWQAFFIGDTKAVIVTDYQKENGSCVWVLGPEDIHHPLIDDYTREWLFNSDLSRISRYPEPGFPKWDIIPPLSEKSWCFYFQKADLAAQFNDWEEVVRLWNESVQYRSQMTTSTELTPFIKGFIHTKNFHEALELTFHIQNTIASTNLYLCNIWQDSLSVVDISPDEFSLLSPELNSLECSLSNTASAP